MGALYLLGAEWMDGFLSTSAAPSLSCFHSHILDCEDPLRIARPAHSGFRPVISGMNSSSYPKTRGLPLSSPSPTELKRQRAKLAFYELPITAFDCPVENDPREAALRRRQERLLATCGAKTKMARTKTQKNGARAAHKRGLLARFVGRIRSWCTASSRAMGGNGGSKTPPHSGFSDDFYGALAASSLPRGMDLDESTRFRLQLAGLRIHGEHPSSHPQILTL